VLLYISHVDAGSHWRRQCEISAVGSEEGETGTFRLLLIMLIDSGIKDSAS
jgi:hypothetical protein